MRKALIIGGAGFVGVHSQRLMRQNFAVTATGHESDLRDGDQVRRLVAGVAPDIVINLASITTVRESFANPHETYRIGFLGTLNLLAAFKGTRLQGKNAERQLQ
jgi:nucleoside-diphosphate-sugar epimerase